MEQMLEAAVAIADPDARIYGTTMPIRWRAETYAFGARPFGDDGTVEGFLNGPKTLAAFQFFYDLARSGAVPTPAEFAVLETEGTGPVDLFSTGRLGLANLNNFHFKPVSEAGVEYGLIHQPTVEGEEIIRNGWTLTTGIPTAAQNPEAAWEWLKFMIGEEGQRILMNAEGSSFIPSVRTLWDELPDADGDNLQFFFRYLDDSYLIQEWTTRFPMNVKLLISQRSYSRKSTLMQ